jgi:hypothetical protein
MDIKFCYIRKDLLTRRYRIQLPARFRKHRMQLKRLQEASSTILKGGQQSQRCRRRKYAVSVTRDFAQGRVSEGPYKNPHLRSLTIRPQFTGGTGRVGPGFPRPSYRRDEHSAQRASAPIPRWAWIRSGFFSHLKWTIAHTEIKFSSNKLPLETPVQVN